MQKCFSNLNSYFIDKAYQLMIRGDMENNNKMNQRLFAFTILFNRLHQFKLACPKTKHASRLQITTNVCCILCEKELCYFLKNIICEMWVYECCSSMCASMCVSRFFSLLFDVTSCLLLFLFSNKKVRKSQFYLFSYMYIFFVVICVYSTVSVCCVFLVVQTIFASSKLNCFFVVMFHMCQISGDF